MPEKRHVGRAEGTVHVKPEPVSGVGVGGFVSLFVTTHVAHPALKQIVPFKNRQQPLPGLLYLVVRALKGSAVVENDDDRVSARGKKLDQILKLIYIDRARAVEAADRRDAGRRPCSAALQP